MSYLDHICLFPTEQEARAFFAVDADLDQDVPPQKMSVGSLSFSRLIEDQRVTLLPVKIVRAKAVFGEPNTEGNQAVITPEETAPGYWIVARCKQLLSTATTPYCIAVASNDLVKAGEPFLSHVKVPIEALQNTVSPVFAGSGYPFGPTVGAHSVIG